jgi:energy-coupling factor transporter ATP-binding protein EcfA2
MFVTDVRIENVRGFGAGKSAVDLTFASEKGAIPQWVVVAGRNGAGKSTFLQCIAASIAGPPVARVLAESFDGWIRDGAKSAIVATRLEFSDADGFAAGRKPTFVPWAGIRWTRSEDGPEPLMQPHRVGGNWTATRGPWAENPKGWFLAGYGPFRRLSTAPTEAQRLMMLPGRPGSLASLFREEASLSESLQWLQQLYLRRLEGRVDAERLEQIVLRLLDDGLLPEGMRVLRVTSDGLWVKTPAGGELPLRALSDGYRTVAALVVDILRQMASQHGDLIYHEREGRAVVENEGVVLIDEIDVHLHVSWQQRIGFWLKDHFPRMQFIVSTHSPFICQAADEGGLIRLAAPGDETGAENMIGERYQRVVHGTADDAILSELFGLETAYSPATKALRDELTSLEIHEQDLDDAELERLEDLREQVPQSPSEGVAKALRQFGFGNMP